VQFGATPWLALSLLVHPPAARAAPVQTGAPRLLLFKVSVSSDIVQATALLYEDALQRALNRTGQVQVLGRSDLQTMVEVSEAIGRARSCVDEDCLLKLDELIDVRFFVSAHLAVVDENLVVSVKVFDRQSRSVPARGARVLTRDVARLDRDLEALAEDLLNQLGPFLPARAGLWQRFDTTGRIGVVMSAGGAVCAMTAVVLWMLSSRSAGQVREGPEDTLSNQPAAARARTLAQVSGGFWLGSALLLGGGGTLAYFGYQPDGEAEGEAAHVGARWSF